MGVPVTVAAGGEQGTGGAANRAEEDRALFARYLDKRDPVDREALVERFLPLARQLARRYEHGREDLDDLEQVAAIGLLKAIDRLSRWSDPTVPPMPSTTIVLACIIVGPYS